MLGGHCPSRTGADILDLLTALNENGRTIILVTHDEHVAARTRRVLHMQDGMLCDGER